MLVDEMCAGWKKTSNLHTWILHYVLYCILDYILCTVLYTVHGTMYCKLYTTNIELQLPEAVLIQFASPDDEHDVLETCREL
jgi:hypothetical protein